MKVDSNPDTKFEISLGSDIIMVNYLNR
jgi:hypothetical protein